MTRRYRLPTAHPLVQWLFTRRCLADKRCTDPLRPHTHHLTYLGLWYYTGKFRLHG